MHHPWTSFGFDLNQAVEARLSRDYSPIFNPEDRRYSTDELLQKSEGTDAMLPCHTENLSSEVIEKLPDSVKAIANFSVGVDHCDLNAAKKKGIIVTNTPDVLTDATAEIAMLCLLGAARRAGEGERLIRERKWNTWSPDFMVGTQVTGKRIGIIGMGRVGQVTARRARGFDMQVHYYNRRRLPEALEQGAVFHESLSTLLPISDFLALHCPSTPETQDLVNEALIAQLPKGAILVNTARGNVIDEDALINALRSGRLRAAGLDVYKNEPAIREEFSQLENLFALPHVGSATHDRPPDGDGYE
ncbi:MAG: D-glycerate dehydrogenase [Gammaproteobacteria bacterium]|nr:D-glycerate dehydrogenase [Gammaproteobacteria bacterium]